MPFYKVEGHAMWFITDVPTKRNAASEAIAEWGRGCNRIITKATNEDIAYFKNLKGENAVSPSGEY